MEKESLTLSREELNQLLFSEDMNNYIDCDTSTGDFDSEKGAMTDYSIDLYREGKLYRGRGGYFTGVTGHVFNYPIEFEIVETEIETEIPERIFSIFRVYDYKGGELSTSTNLFIEDLCCELAETLELGDVSSLSEEEISEKIEKITSENFFFNYAGSDRGFCGKIYEHVENQLKEVKFVDFLPQIASYVKTNW